MDPSNTKRSPTCARCGAELPPTTRGRPKKYCSQSCRQRSYEQRHGARGVKLDEGAVVLSAQRVEELRDQLFELRCAAEDIDLAVREQATAQEITELCTELVSLAKRIEKVR